MSVARYSVIVAFVVTLAVIAGGFMRLSAQLTLSAPTVSNITQTSVTISWTTDVPATTQVSYGLTYNYTDQTSRIDALTTEHTQTLSGLAPGTIYHYLVGSGNGTSFGAVGDNTFTTLAAADTPPVITLSVYPPTTSSIWRPGTGGRYAWSITDDKPLQSAVITTSQMMYSGMSDDVSYKCQGKTFCEEKAYAIYPSNPGAQFVTVTATDSANQTATKTVTFDASACTTDADCGGGAIQWAGASFCGAEGGAGLETDIMQYGVGATCKSGGICDTSSLPRVKQKCATGQVCTFGSNGVNLCIAPPLPCTVGAQITSICTCGNVTLNYPYDWRVSMPTYCCSNGGSFFTSGGSPCSTFSSSVSSASSSPKSASASTLSMSSVSTSGGAGGTLAPPSWSSAAPVHASPSADVPSVPSAPSPAIVPPSAPQSMNERVVPPQNVPVIEQRKRVNIPGSKKEDKLLKGKITQSKKKIASIEKNILSFERKIDVKLLLLDRMKSEGSQKRIHAQIDRWEEKIASLEVQKEKKEAALEDLQVSLEQWKAAGE